MSMVKVINPRGWNWERPVAQLVKVSSRGLIGSDRSDFIKLAGDTAPAFLGIIDSIKFAKDEEPVHMLAMGSTEGWGKNRNGDGFKEATCRRYFNTFEKFAKFFRNHKNTSSSPAFGSVKKGTYSNAMRRIELLVGLNKTKEAALRNGGEFGQIADQELEKLARGDDFGVSMSCRVSHDVCDGCGNKARTRADYCTDATCKYGGCRDNLAKVAADGFILGVDNPDPVFFDISHVYRPADRTAYGAKADWLAKAASVDDFTGGAALADALGITAPLSVCLAGDDPWHWSEAVRDQKKIAMALALWEEAQTLHPETRRALDPSLREPLTEDQLTLLGPPGTEKSAAALSAMADQKVMLGFDDFARWTRATPDDEAAARQLLPGVFHKLAEDSALEKKITENRFVVSGKTASVAQQILARNLFSSRSLASDAVSERAMRSSMRGLIPPTYKNAFVKWAGVSTEAVKLAEDYALYQVSALHHMAGFDQSMKLTARLAIGQNSV